MSKLRPINMKAIFDKVAFYFQNNLRITTKNALGLSIFLHLALGLAVAGIYGEHLPSLISSGKKSVLEFDIITNKFEKKISNEAYDNIQASSAAKKAAKLIGVKATANKKIVAENVNINESAMLASLESLTALKQTFSFVAQEISADSAGVFAPIQGEAPDTKAIAAGLINGYGYGGREGIISLGGGNGKCPPRPSPLP